MTRPVFGSHSLRASLGLPSLRRKIALAALAACLLAVEGARAQKTDYDFARGLAQRGYFDLAEEVLNRAGQDPKATADQKALNRLGLAVILKQAAETETDADEKVKKYRDAERTFDSVMKELGSSHPRYYDAVFESGDLLQRKGTYVARQLGEEKDSGKRKTLQTEAKQAFEQAMKQFSKMVEHFAPEREKSEEAELEWEKARYHQAINPYFLAQTEEKGSLEREVLLKRAAEALNDLMWELSRPDDPVQFYCLIFKGKCHAERGLESDNKGEISSAKNAFDDVVSLAKEEGNVDNFQELIEWAYQEYAKLLIDTREFIDCDKVVKEMLAALKTRPIAGPGWCAMMSQAEALHNIGQDDRAQLIAKQVADGARGSTCGKQASEFLARLVGEGGAAEASLSVLLSTARGLSDSGRLMEAVRVYQEAAAKIKTPEEQKQHGASTWNAIGRCFNKLGRFQEAGLAFEEGAERYAEPESVFTENVTGSYNAFRNFAAETKNEFDQARSKAARDRASKLPAGTDFAYNSARDQLDEGRFAEAYAAFKKIESPSAPKFDSAWFLVAKCAFDEGERVLNKEKNEARAHEWFDRLDSDGKLYSQLVEDPKYASTDPTVLAARKQTKAAFVYFQARSRQMRKEPEKALELLSGFHDSFGDQDKITGPAAYVEVSSLVDLNRLADAEQRVLALAEKYPNSPEVTRAINFVGEAYRSAAKKIENPEGKGPAGGPAKEPDPALLAQSRPLREKSADILYQWTKRPGASVKPVSAMLIGEMYVNLGRFDRAEEVLGAAWKRTKDDAAFAQRDTLAILYSKTLLGLAKSNSAKYQEAEPLLADLYEQRCVKAGKPGPNGKIAPKLVPGLMLDYATCLGGLLEQKPDGKWHRDDGVKKYDKALEIYAELVTRYPDKTSDLWYEAKLETAFMVYKQGTPQATETARIILNNFLRTDRAAVAKSPIKPKYDYLENLLK